MSTFNKEIDDILEKALVEKTFSLEVVDRIKKMRDDYVVMEKKTEDMSRSIETLLKENSEIRKENNSVASREEAVTQREVAVTAREAKKDLEDSDLRHATSRANEIKEILGIVFKNPLVREQVYKSINTPLMNPSGYTTSVSGNESETRTTEKE